MFLEFRWRIWSRIESENPSHPPEHAFFVTSWKVTSPESNLKDISRIKLFKADLELPEHLSPSLPLLFLPIRSST